MAKKFNQYLIQITHSNGQTEDIEYTNCDKTSYQGMLKVYKTIKEEYSNVNCVIDFLGINEKERVVIFKKYNEIEELSDEIIDTVSESSEDLFELIEQFQNNISKIKNRGNVVKAKMSEIDAQISYIYHADIEISKDSSTEHKVETYDKLKFLFDSRRNYKHEHGLICSLNNKNVLNSLSEQLGDMQKSVKVVTKNSTKAVSKIKKYTDGEAQEVDIYNSKYYKYNNFTERMTLMKNLTPQFSKIVNDEVNSQLICSNKKATKATENTNLTHEEKEVAKLVKSKGGSIKYKTFVSRDAYVELLNEKFHTVFVDEMSMKITCGNLKKGF